MSNERIKALREALALTPDNHPLRQMLAEALQAADDIAAALVEFEHLLNADVLAAGKLVSIGRLSVKQGNLDLAARCLDRAVSNGIIEGVARLRALIDTAMEAQGYMRVIEPPMTANGGEIDDEPDITFADVGGLDAVKQTIHRMIILPYLRPELYKRYGRRSGGGVLMYGPPGCGKTLLARATAGECELPFINIRIEEIIDPFIGVSERNLHQAFEGARSISPCVIFLDELDGLAFARRKRTTSVGRSLVDQLLQELDAIGADNRGLLVIGATNAPWDVDDAMLRPGRFDRRLFVPPPDATAREQILHGLIAGVPQENIRLHPIVRQTTLYSGADLKALVDSAIDRVIAEALQSGQEPPLTQDHLAAALAESQPTTVEWLRSVQNYVEFANTDQRYDAVADYLNSREVQRAIR